KTNEWHPHIHVFALLDDWIDQDELSQYWQSITGDSMVVDIRRDKKQKDLGYSGAADEVCKYALKFGDLSVEKTWEAFKVLKGKRL
ncbi:replication protein, partial [Acinetobacter baumannii]|nr:replication protein [Acinetobacter baumannii]